ncbi:MAG TPA: single-stranded-DNA-specific exonuclease RecJ [Dehalococcoidia bacterium]|nr:single-stranded-DNA-specific exonuclease RecJ [Dehalococcoidia bacterium]
MEVNGGARTPRFSGYPRRRWRGRPRPPVLPEGPFPPLIQRLLALRGCRTPRDAEAFLYGGAARPNPFQLPDMEPAVERLRRACREGEVVAVYGDFDVDGTTACAILTEGLSALGARPVPYVPDRFAEGYGLNVQAIEGLRRRGATLLLTADCGTSSIEEIAFARSRGMDVIVLDHHSAPPDLPAALALVNPKLPGADVDGMADLASCGLALQLMAALYDASGRAFDEERYVDLVALGTVCDVAPLTGANRDLVRRGLKALARAQRPGLRALMETAGVDPAGVTTDHIAFALGPRLNAAGRMAHARLALELLTTADERHARSLAAELDRLNADRQRATNDAIARAGAAIERQGDRPLVMLGDSAFSSGIVGLVAARIAERWYRPAVVYEHGPSTSRASCRSIPEFDITGALREMPELFLRFGGHHQAAGFTAENDRLDQIRERLEAIAERELAGVTLAPVIDIDAAVSLQAVTGEEIRWLRLLGPFGAGNPEPTFLARGLEVVDQRAVGADGAHLRLRLRSGTVVWPAIAFRQAERAPAVGDRIDAVFCFSTSGRNGDAGLELRIEDFRPSETRASSAG